MSKNAEKKIFSKLNNIYIYWDERKTYFLFALNF